MIQSFEALILILQVQLTAEERVGGVAYAIDRPVAAGTRLDFPGTVIEFPAEAYIAFIDGEPTANWGHSARYVLVTRDTGDVRSIHTRLPPFRREAGLHWRVIYKAPSVPEAAVAVPQ
jgi:hypothetical protein